VGPREDVVDVSSIPKFAPERVIAALPEVGVFVAARTEMTGLSYVIDAEKVPATEKSWTIVLNLAPVPGPTEHRRAVVLTQDVVWHLVLPTKVEGVRFKAPNSVPASVRRTTGSPEVGMFDAPVTSDTAGAS